MNTKSYELNSLVPATRNWQVGNELVKHFFKSFSHMFSMGAVAPRGSNLFGLGDDETDGFDGERSYIR